MCSLFPVCVCIVFCPEERRAVLTGWRTAGLIWGKCSDETTNWLLPFPHTHTHTHTQSSTVSEQEGGGGEICNVFDHYSICITGSKSYRYQTDARGIIMILEVLYQPAWSDAMEVSAWCYRYQTDATGISQMLQVSDWCHRYQTDARGISLMLQISDCCHRYQTDARGIRLMLQVSAYCYRY